MEPRIGAWTVERELGRGAMGVVLRVRADDGRRAALKLLQASASAHARRRLENEASAMTRLSHPHLVRVLETGEHAGRPYVVMDLIDGESLATRLEREGPLEPRRAAAIGQALALALEHCHRAGVLHRDLKPANVLLDRRGEPHLVDFGLALDLDAARTRLTQEGNVLGTPGYWPPEQARGDLQAIDARSDVYALGATLYAMLTGQPPFTGTNLVELLHQAEHTPPTPPSDVHPGVDPSLGAIVTACLAKDPRSRPQSAAALAGLLERWLAGERALPARRRRALLALGLLVIGLALAGLILDRTGRGRRALARELDEAAARRVPPDEESLALLDRSLALVDDPVTRYHRSELLCLLGREDQARAELDRIIATRPDMAAAWITRAELRPAEERQVALQEVEEALRLEPLSCRALEVRARLRERGGDLEGAIADVSHALRLRPAWPDSLIQRALLREKQGNLPGALADVAELLRLQPDSKRALTLRGQLREKQGDVPGAVEDWLQAARLAGPDEKGGAVALLVGLRQRQKEEALLVRELSELLDERETGERRYHRAQARYRIGDLRGAREDLERAVALEPKNAYTWALLASVEGRDRNFARAEELLDRAIAVDPALLGLYMNRAGVRIELEKWAEAEADVRKVLTAEPQRADAHLRLGVLRHRQGRLDEALLHYDQAISMDPKLTQAHTDRASSLLELGRPAEALPSLRTAREQLPPGPARDRVDADISQVEALLAR